MFKIIISLTVTKVLFKIWNRPAADDSPLALPNVSGCVLVCELNMYTDIRHWNRIPTRTAILSRLVHSSHIHTIIIIIIVHPRRDQKQKLKVVIFLLLQ